MRLSLELCLLESGMTCRVIDETGEITTFFGIYFVSTIGRRVKHGVIYGIRVCDGRCVEVKRRMERRRMIRGFVGVSQCQDRWL